MSSRRILSALAVGALAATLMVDTARWSSVRADSENSLRNEPIVASWHVTVAFDDGRPDVLALYTFNRDRTFTMGGSWPGLFSPGHGAWNRNRDDDSSSVNLTFFRLLYTPLETNETTGTLNGTFNGTLKVQAKLTVGDDGQGFTGRYSLTNFDPAGNVRSTTAGNLNATLIVVEALP